MMKKLTGQIRGRLTVLRRVGTKNGCAVWLCHCACGKEVEVQSRDLSGHTQSCGCLARELTVVRLTMGTQSGLNHPGLRHGHATKHNTTPTYRSYRAMVMRCTNPNDDNWFHYGGANPPVLVCDRWLGEHGFENFLADMGERPAGTSLGRFGDVGNYEPDNCIWHIDAEQKVEQKVKRQLAFLAVRNS